MYGWRTRLVFCYYSVTISEQILTHMNIRISLPKGGTISAHRNANGLLEDLVSKDYIDIVYKKAKHGLNVCFRVLVWAIRVVSQKIFTVPTERNLTESEPRPRANAERTQSGPRANPERTQIFTSGPNKRSLVHYCVIELSIRVVVNWLDNGGMEL
jgi:hypothetical protein